MQHAVNHRPQNRPDGDMSEGVFHDLFLLALKTFGKSGLPVTFLNASVTSSGENRFGR